MNKILNSFDSNEIKGIPDIKFGLKEINIQCTEKIITDNFNINAIGNKLNGLFFMIVTNIDILLNLESKLD